MKIDHIAIWTTRLEKMKAFYETYFGGISVDKYINQKKKYESYFVSFSSGSRIELMSRLDVTERLGVEHKDYLGLAHIAFHVGDRPTVDQLTGQLRADGFAIFSEPRTTGDGYYESIVLDPDGNKVEIVA